MGECCKDCSSDDEYSEDELIHCALCGEDYCEFHIEFHITSFECNECHKETCQSKQVINDSGLLCEDCDLIQRTHLFVNGRVY